MKFDGKVAIITGAASGLGKATAELFARNGAKVAIVDINREQLEQVGDSIRAAGGEVLVLTVDVSKNDQVQSAVADTLAAFGHVDILVNNAGAGWQGSGVGMFKDLLPEDWEWILDLNVKGTMYFTQAVANHMVERKYGKIINVASVAANKGIPKLAVYSASKGAMVSFTKAIAMELGQYGINVNCISPGLITTENPPPQSDGTFLGRKGTADEMALLIEFLASDDASFITGVDYLIDGGRTLGLKGA